MPKNVFSEKPDAAKLRHPNIIGVTNVTENGVHFIVMDYVDGKTLQTIISEKIEPQRQ